MAEIIKIIKHPLYQDDLRMLSEANYIPWSDLQNKTILLIGATGMIGSCFVDVIMYCNKHYCYNIKLIAISRNVDKAKARFSKYWNEPNFKFIQHDCFKPFYESIENVDYAIHAASNTHPMAYSTDPIGTITTNVFGTYNLLEYLKNQKQCRILFLSSVEIYGENNTNKDEFSETDCGYIDCNIMRAGYPESKRVSESLCQAYISKYDMNIVIARLCRVYGPTILDSDSKALAQFIHKAINSEDIILKSKGNQYFSYIYVFDAIASLLTILLKGKSGEAYNISDKKSDITLAELAQILANINNKKVIFQLPDSKESVGYSKATKAILNSEKLSALGWYSKNTITENLIKTVKILRLDL